MVSCKYLEDRTKEGCEREGVSLKRRKLFYVDVWLIMKRFVIMETGEEVSPENVWDSQVKDHPEVLHEDGSKKASANGSPPSSGVARKGANLHQKHR